LSSLAATACDNPPPTPDAAATPDATLVDDAGNDAGVALDAYQPPDAWFTGVPPFRNPVATPDLELARQALRLLGAPAAGATELYCNDCHGLTRQTIRNWRALSDQALTTCLTDLDVGSDASAADMVACFRNGEVFDPEHVGIFSTAAELSWFRYVFEHGAGGSWETEYANFVEQAGMPPGGSPHAALDQAQFDIVAEWFIRGVPGLEEVLPEDPAPTECMTGVSADMIAHGERMASMGWGQRARDAGMLMHGCPPGATSPTECFATETRAADTTYGAAWDVVPGTAHRVLFTTDYVSAYWTRSSPDGRFVAHGAAVSGTQRGRFIDLQRGVAIPSAGSYDPAFFPDLSGFMFQGMRAYVCEMNVLTSEPASISFTESGCSNNRSVGLYQHVGAALSGGDYWSMYGLFVSDDGGHEPTLAQPATDFGADATTRFTRLVNTGSTFSVMGTTSVRTPFEGDGVMAASGELLVNRVSGPGGVQLGYVLRSIAFDTSGPSLTVETPEIARYCFSGGKPTFSYDEQWMIIHHYVTAEDAVELGFTGPTDPAFAPYLTQGASNIYLVRLATGERTRLTNMQPGQYALYPHFRADDWVYFLVRTLGERPEHVVASDAFFAIRG
ncbi:MAG: hypothetical protein K1X94_34090, partial [Sandaracinaceae bacterium]|nr:hypothetical protein [Sandaracinaceae bacterium]